MSKQITATDCKPMIIWDVTILDQTIRVEARSGYWAARKAAKAILGTESVQYDCYSTRGLAVATKMHRNYHVHLVEAAYYMAEMETAEVETEQVAKVAEVIEIAEVETAPTATFIAEYIWTFTPTADGKTLWNSERVR